MGEEKTVGLKTDNIAASSTLVDEGLITKGLHGVDGHQSVLVREYGGNIDGANITAKPL